MEDERERERSKSSVAWHHPGSVHGPWWSTYHNVISIPLHSYIYIYSMYLYVFVFLSFGHARPEPLGITGQCARLSLISYFSPRDTTVISYVKSYFPNSLSLSFSFLPTDTFAFIFPRIEVRASNYFFLSFIFFSFFFFRESSRGRISIDRFVTTNGLKRKNTGSRSVPERIEFKEFF